MTVGSQPVRTEQDVVLARQTVRKLVTARFSAVWPRRLAQGDNTARALDFCGCKTHPSARALDCHQPTRRNTQRLSTESSMRLIFATASETRRQLLSAAGVQAEAMPARIDEDAIRHALEAESAKPRDIADTLAEMKARKIAEKHPDARVIGCDQVLAFENRVWGKPETPDIARDQLRALRGRSHQLLSAVVVYEDARPVWRHIADVRLTMGNFSDAWLDDYLARNWDSIRHSVGGYKLEEEGVRMFTDIRGDYFTVLGLPLLPLLAWLGNRGAIAA